MKAHCQCTSSNVAYGQMAMPTMAPWPEVGPRLWGALKLCSIFDRFRALPRPTKDCKIGSLAASLASINICIVVRHHYCLAGNNSPFNYLRVYLSNLIENSNIRGFLQKKK